MRWLPAVAAPALIAAGVLAGTIPARAGDRLPEKSPAEVLALVQQHRARTFSGTIEQSSDLGLPKLPAAGPSRGPAAAGGAASATELLAGDHTARIYMDGKAKVRVQVVDRLAERDLVRRGQDVWFYSSRDNSTAHLSLPAKANDLPLPVVPDQPALPEAPPAEGTEPGTPQVPTPAEIAARLLAKVEPSTAVTVGEDVEVAGRAAYNLVLEPRTDATLVGSAAIAVDGETGMPLSVRVTARGAGSPAFSAGFTSLSYDAPDDSLFTFVPPPGSTVEELRPGHYLRWPANFRAPGMVITPEHLAAIHQHPARPSVTGKAWEAVVEIPAAAAGGSFAEALLEDPLLSQAAVVVPGGRLLSTALLNVLVTDDGRIFAGMVPADRLQAAVPAAT